MSTNPTTAPVVTNRWESYDLNFNATKSLLKKETSENSFLAVVQKVAYVVAAAFVAIGEAVLYVLGAAANGAIWAANRVNNYFADNGVKEEIEVVTNETPAVVEQPVAQAVVEQPVVQPVVEQPVAQLVVVEQKPADVVKTVPHIPTRTEKAKELGNTILSYVGTGLSKAGSFLYTVTYPVRNLESFAKDAYQVARHPVDTKEALKNWYYGPQSTQTVVAEKQPEVAQTQPLVLPVVTPVVQQAVPA